MQIRRLGVQGPIAPLDGVPNRVVVIQVLTPDSGERSRVGGRLGGDLVEPERLGPRASQLDGQRQPVDVATDPADHREIGIGRRSRVGGPQTLQEQLDRRGAGRDDGVVVARRIGHR